MKAFKNFFLGVFVAAIAGLAGLALAATTYPGFLAVVGAQVDLSTDAPVIAQTGQTISAQLGGANAGQWVATGATTGAGTLTFPSAAPNGRYCDFTNRHTAADVITQTDATDGKTVVTIAGTIVSGDKISYSCWAF